MHIIRLRLLFLFLYLFIGLQAGYAHNAPKYEVRAVWLTTIGGIDWPHSYARTPQAVAKQKAEFCDILDRLQRANINTILLQTRVRATTIFQSTADSGNEPWDGCLSGQPGTSPGYDALEYAIEECHRRGMELHAWVVTIPVGKWNGYGCRQLRSRHPELVIRIGDEGFMDPASSATATYLSRYCRDIVRRYDVDGIHLDYIRYPETMKRLPKADEGRRNITRIVQAVHREVKKEKDWVKLSCSPVGKHDDTSRYWSHGWNARSRVLQDAKAWMRDGLMDMEFPMMYFRGNNFYPFAVDWQEGSAGRQVVPGLGIYFLHPKEKDWPLIEITRQLQVLRNMGMGFCFFRSKFFTDDTKGLFRYVCDHLCRYPSLIPPVSGHGHAPSAPSDMRVLRTDHGTVIGWQNAVDRSSGDYLVYNVYASHTYPVSTDTGANLLITRHRGETLTVPPSSSHMYYAVTAVDRYGRESAAVQEQAPLDQLPAVIKPGWWWVTHPLGK